jgi:hypothetical protein
MSACQDSQDRPDPGAVWLVLPDSTRPQTPRGRFVPRLFARSLAIPPRYRNLPSKRSFYVPVAGRVAAILAAPTVQTWRASVLVPAALLRALRTLHQRGRGPARGVSHRQRSDVGHGKGSRLRALRFGGFQKIGNAVTVSISEN